MHDIFHEEGRIWSCVWVFRTLEEFNSFSIVVVSYSNSRYLSFAIWLITYLQKTFSFLPMVQNSAWALLAQSSHLPYTVSGEIYFAFQEIHWSSMKDLVQETLEKSGKVHTHNALFRIQKVFKTYPTFIQRPKKPKLWQKWSTSKTLFIVSLTDLHHRTLQ